ncbi:MAG: aminotransferase class I/II-fold pyridoxal phosphate-dependent enzyme [Fusobacterium sp. JB021]|nr:aminotransferase class I/II-fold pyridoxal phosphate-dependent enzyme [Fusobacterium sp. JB020]MDP0492949.1 aminotransferase class I/II-fold pyridoxal phosphate-dependent enzyme [Fusobacterium sp. JB021]MDP0506375.1 aminotransferase class I/II-fold pyridoxal phosphate-dependent enzyme [Fusobacterium sp. JB019]
MKKDKIISQLNRKKEENNFRTLKKFNEKDLNLSSNDYLGLAHDEKLKEKFYKEFKNEVYLSSSSSRLITGNYKGVVSLENKLEKIYGKPGLVMNSGFSANKTIIDTFYNKESLIITDKLNHASIYDGIISSKCKILRYRHLDTKHLEDILIKYRDKYEDVLIISETTYSMEGDTANLKKLVELKKKYNCDLMIDEAHSYGVNGYGVAYNLNLVKDIEFLVIPLGKGGGSIGSYIICENYYKDYLINFGREFIYTTSLPPVNNLWNLFILENMNNFQEKREKLKELIDFTFLKIKELEIEVVSDSHILGLIIGDNKKVDIISKRLRDKGYIVYSIKSPTVGKGTERIRIGLNPDITKEEIEKFLKEFKHEYNSIF